MAEQRQPFRFRLPWQTLQTTPTPTPAPTPAPAPQPSVETQRPAQPTATVPLQRPPFRPPGIAPVLPPPSSQAQAPQKTEPQLPSINASTEITQAVVQPAALTAPSTTQTQAALPSPSRTATQTRAMAFVPPTPSSATPQSQVASMPSSTSQTQPAPQTTSQLPWSLPASRLSSQPAGQTTSQPSSPARKANQLQPTGTTKLQPTIQETSTPTPTPTPTEPRTSEQELKPAVSQQLSQEPQSKAQVQPSETVSKSHTEPRTSEQEPKTVVSQQPSQEPQSKAQVLPSETVSKSQNHTPIESSSQPNGAATQATKVSPTSIVATETIAPPQKLDSNAIIGGDVKPLPERKVEEEKTSGLAHEEPTKRTVTELLTAAKSASVAKAKDLVSAAFPGKQKQKEEKEEAFDRKEAVVIQEQRTRKQMDSARSIQPAVIFNGEHLPVHEEVRKDIFKFVHNLSTGQSTAENPVSVITLTGENRGASMHLGPEPAKKEGSVHIHRGYKLNPDESTEATTDGEESSKAKKSKDPMAQNPPSRIYINSNIQSVNNSILFNGSVAERNPGVSLVVSHNQEEPIKSNGQPKALETRRAEFNVTPAEKLTYEPAVRRRCLRGLFMEPSDSDPDNPEKPRRHGCRHNCAEKDKDKEIGIH
ncbi:uncharacterized protein LOC132182775 [Corylus avellana]|uniref:uncharacterized protein LOC132182775 n=1 Tax=Corylus avellana TaxID=13451 RepID=UPI00286B04FB|nr:uncharacterized protein LOC132182775 [Corylus avellana]